MLASIKILKNEFKLIRRDVMVFMLPFFVVYMGLVLRFLMPWLNEFLETGGFMPGSVSVNPFSYYYPLVMYYMVIITGPQISGAVYAILILSDKDDQTLKALMVTPLSADAYIKRKTLMSIVTGVIFVLALFYMINIDMLPFWQLLLIAICAGLTSSLITLTLGIIADNKVQGMSYGKGISFIALVILSSFFVEGNLQLLFGILPPFWGCRAYTLALEGASTWWVYLCIGIIYQGGLTLYLMKVFKKVIYKTI